MMETARPVAGAGGAGDGNGQEHAQSNTRPPATQHPTLPNTAAEREVFLAEMRRLRMAFLQAVYHVDFIGTSVQHQMLTVEDGRAMIDEMLEPAGDGTET